MLGIGGIISGCYCSQQTRSFQHTDGYEYMSYKVYSLYELSIFFYFLMYVRQVDKMSESTLNRHILGHLVY